MWEGVPVALFLWIVAVMLLVSGLGLLVRGQVLWGIAIIVTALLVGPGGVSLFT
jgi:TM2 domain-containing membrane protein YozV